MLMLLMSSMMMAQETVPNEAQGVAEYGESLPMFYVPSLASRNALIPAEYTEEEARDRRSIRNKVVIGKEKQETDDYYVLNRHETEQSIRVMPPSVVFDAYSSGSQPFLYAVVLSCSPQGIQIKGRLASECSGATNRIAATSL